MAVVGDIRHVKLPSAANIGIVIGGPPCQGFSVAGKMDLNDPRSKHVWDFLNIVRRVEPKAFVMENVRALAENRRFADIGVRDADPVLPKPTTLENPVTVQENWVIEYHKHLINGCSPIHEVPERMRRLTVKEAAILQSFPNEMIFCGSQSSKYRQIGNAVPPKLAQAVATATSKALGEKPFTDK